jgi:hypothetical protein
VATTSESWASSVCAPGIGSTAIGSRAAPIRLIAGLRAGLADFAVAGFVPDFCAADFFVAEFFVVGFVVVADCFVADCFVADCFVADCFVADCFVADCLVADFCAADFAADFFAPNTFASSLAFVGLPFFLGDADRVAAGSRVFGARLAVFFAGRFAI